MIGERTRAHTHIHKNSQTPACTLSNMQASHTHLWTSKPAAVSSLWKPGCVLLVPAQLHLDKTTGIWHCKVFAEDPRETTVGENARHLSKTDEHQDFINSLIIAYYEPKGKEFHLCSKTDRLLWKKWDGRVVCPFKQKRVIYIGCLLKSDVNLFEIPFIRAGARYIVHLGKYNSVSVL